MTFRKIAVGLSVITVINTGTPAIQVLANEANTNIKVIQNQNNDTKENNTKARVNKFTALQSENMAQYDELYKIDKSNIQSITTNGKNSSEGPIEHAVDGNIETFWHTGKLNSDTFTNEVVVEFKENVDIDRIVYGNRRGVDRGFAESFSIYGASSNDSEFVKIADGEHKNTQDFLEIDFEKTNVKKIKFVFNKGTANWASIAEMWFYKEDETSSKMNRLFSDDTLSMVSEEFNSVEKIQALENELKQHLLYDVYKSKLEDAKSLVENEKVVAVEAKITPFEVYNNEEYSKTFKMDNSNIESIKNNAGNNVGKPISNAIDGDLNTEWASNTVNTDKFTNEVEIVFKDKVVLDRVVYGARQSDIKGFAEEFEIYGSKTTSGDTYELIATGKYNPVKGLIEAQFNSTEFKRMKFKFKKSKDNWATISEIAFYKEDAVSDKMKRLFTDNTLSVVSEEFNTIEKIEALENEAKSHPLYNTFKLKIEDAKALVGNEKVEVTNAKISQFNLFDNEKYSEAFKIDNSNIESIKNNAGHNVGKPLSNATDGDLNTEWASNKVNSDTFTNEVELVFKEKILIDRVVYGARQSDTIGYPEEFEIYGSKTTSGDTYELITTGKSNPMTGLVEMQFKPTEFKRMKFKFKKSKNNWATISEIAFYKQDVLTNKINDIFKDGTMTELKDEFNSKEVIDSLASEIVNHPNEENLQELIDRAYIAINNGFENQVKINVPQLGDLHGHANRDLLMSSFGTNFITTGIVAKPGEVVEVYVEANKDEPLPQIVFSQSQGHYGKWRRNYQLNPGYNKFVVPEIYDEEWAHKANKGGAVYILNPYTSDEQSKVPVVSIEGGQKFPVFNEGDNQAEFLEELKAYKEYMDANPDSAVDIFEFNSNRILFTGTASDAYQVYVNEGVDIEESIDVWSSRFDEGLKFAGLEDNKNEPQHDSTNLRTAVRVMQPFGAAYAAGDHIGIQKHVADNFLRTDKESIRSIAWGTMHEMGHQADIRPRTWGEVTNNMWANDVYIKEGFGCKVNYNNIDKTVALNHNYDMEFSSVELGMFWQLEAYQDGYWAKLERMYRERRPNPKDYQEKKDILALYSSEIIGKNLTEYYERYGFSLSQNAKSELSKLPKLDQKLWYTHSDKMEYKGSGYNENLEVKANSKINEENKTTTLTFEMDEENKEAFLGYEISKDGEVIGFTRTNTFVVENVNVDENTEYEVIPYDLNVNTGDKIVVNSNKPTVLSEEKVILEVNEEFDLKDYVIARNYKGEALDNVEIKHNIDISKAGVYNVEYTVIDQGLEVSSTTKVEVVSEYDYLSDFEWKSVKTDYSTPRKNSVIKTRVNGESKEFEKGFGIHANGEIVYDLTGKDYDTFEAILGVDTSIIEQDKSSISFKIVVDGKTVKTTKVLKHRDNAVYASVPIEGAKELKIEIHDGGNGISSDHAIIANPKLTNNNSKPSLNIGEEDISIKLGTEYDLLKDVVANDIEDGNLTQSVQIEDGGFDINKTGNYTITYTVSDRNNNTITKTKNILVYSDINYASDVEWVSATTGWRTVNKDKAVGSNNKIKLKVDNTIKEFDKGIGVATNSEIVYNLEDKGYSYFSTYVGTDKNYDDNRTSIDFKILADGVEVYTSKTIRKDSESEFVKIPLDGVKELKLVADNHDGNGLGDFASWADTKFYVTDSKPVLSIEDSIIVETGKDIDILGEFSAIDAEDGDITSNIVVTGHENININKPGRHTLTYTIIDGDGNKVSKERTVTIIDYRDSTYLSDIDWTSAVQSYGTTNKDKNVNGKTLGLTDENGDKVVYEKGIGTHANATVIYDLSDKNYDSFTSYIGVDRELYGRPSSVVFEVYVDGVKKYDSGVMRSSDAKKFLNVDIANAEELKLVVKDAGDGIASDHGTWGDAKLSFVNEDRADLTELKETIDKASSINLDNYTQESVEELNLLIEEANKMIEADLVIQSQADEMVNKLNKAIDSLQDLNQVVEIEDDELRKSIIQTLNLNTKEITIRDMHNLVTLKCDSGYVRSLKGLEYAINLESLNIDYNEVSDISPIKDLSKLNKFSGRENFILKPDSEVKLEDGKFIIEDFVIDLDGERLLPKEVVLSPRENPIELDLNEVLVGNKVIIDSSLIDGIDSLEILYESKHNNYQLYTFRILTLK